MGPSSHGEPSLESSHPPPDEWVQGSPAEGSGLDTACQAIVSGTRVLAFFATGTSLQDCLFFFLFLFFPVGGIVWCVGRLVSVSLFLSLSLSLSSSLLHVLHAGSWPWKLNATKEGAATHLPTGHSPKMDELKGFLPENFRSILVSDVFCQPCFCSLPALFLHSILSSRCVVRKMFVGEFFVTIFWWALCEWSCGNLNAFLFRNSHRFPDGSLLFRALSLLALFVRCILSSWFLPKILCDRVRPCFGVYLVNGVVAVWMHFSLGLLTDFLMGINY